MYQKIQQYVNITEALHKMEHYCAYQDRCHKEVEKKLSTMLLIPEAKEKILLHLMQENYLNEERFAKSFARGKFRIKKWGRLRITRELKSKGISAYNIKTALKEIENMEYLDVFHQIAEKKWASIQEKNVQKRKKKWIDYLMYRGWENAMIFEKLQEFLQANNDIKKS